MPFHQNLNDRMIYNNVDNNNDNNNKVSKTVTDKSASVNRLKLSGCLCSV